MLRCAKYGQTKKGKCQAYVLHTHSTHTNATITECCGVPMTLVILVSITWQRPLQACENVDACRGLEENSLLGHEHAPTFSLFRYNICQRSRSVCEYRAVQGVHQVLKLPLGPKRLSWKCLLLNAQLYDIHNGPRVNNLMPKEQTRQSFGEQESMQTNLSPSKACSYHSITIRNAFVSSPHTHISTRYQKRS